MSTQMRSIDVLVAKALSDPTTLNNLRANPEQELPKLAARVMAELPPPLRSDAWIYRLVVGALGLTVLTTVVGAIALSAQSISPVPDMLTAIGSASVGALAGLLAPVPPASP